MAESDQPPQATVSVKSEDSTERLIVKTVEKDVKESRSVTRSVASKSVAASKASSRGSRVAGSRGRTVALLGLAQVVAGALLAGGGAAGVARGAALARAGAGLWAGCLAVTAGVVGILAGINDCHRLQDYEGGPLLTAFLALSLLCVAGGNSAAVLAATGLQRDLARQPPPAPTADYTFQEEMRAWSPVLSNIAVLVVAAAHCALSVASVCVSARRVCPCLRPRRPFDHNQFDPAFKPPCEDSNDLEKGAELCKELEGKLQGEKKKNGKIQEQNSPEFGSANSKEKLVSRWVGEARAPPPAALAALPPAPLPAMLPPPLLPTPLPHPPAARKRAPPLVLLPAHTRTHPPPHPATTLGRLGAPTPCVFLGTGGRYATLPLPPPYAHCQPPPLYYPMHDTRMRRRRSPRGALSRRRRERLALAGERDAQLRRSLERIHRKRRAEKLSDADLKRTYTGLDRTYAEQFIAVCDESRHHAAEQHDSLASTSATSATTASDTSHTHTT